MLDSLNKRMKSPKQLKPSGMLGCNFAIEEKQKMRIIHDVVMLFESLRLVYSSVIIMSYYGRKLAIGTLGVYISYISISYIAQNLQARLQGRFNTRFGPESEHFQYPSLVTWMGCLLCSIYGLIYAEKVEKQPNFIPIKERMRLGLLFTLNYLPTNYALLYISYPLQVVAKNTRYILVVIVGVFFSRVEKSRELKLPISKLFIGIFISLGAGLFMYYESTKEVQHLNLDPLKRWIGYLLLLLAVVSDALFSDSQAYCKANFKPTPNQLFLASNLYGFALIFMFALVSGQLRPSILFCLKYPTALLQLITIGCLQVAGQVSVYYVISNFKQHIYPLISTTRKILTILLSILVFHHRINKSQWIALAIVFFSMGYELYDEIASQEYHREVRKRRQERSHQGSQITENKLAQSQVNVNENNQEDTANLTQSGLRKSRSLKGSRAHQLERLNRFIAKDLLQPRNPDKENAESLSKYGYGWRIGEVVEARETSLSPIRKIDDI